MKEFPIINSDFFGPSGTAKYASIVFLNKRVKMKLPRKLKKKRKKLAELKTKRSHFITLDVGGSYKKLCALHDGLYINSK